MRQFLAWFFDRQAWREDWPLYLSGGIVMALFVMSLALGLAVMASLCAVAGLGLIWYSARGGRT